MTPKPTSQRQRVSVEGIDVHVLWNAPVEASSTTSPAIVFGRVVSGDEATAVRDVEGETAGEGDGDGDDNGKDGIASSSTVDPMRVEGVRLAGESLHAQHHTSRAKDLPRSSRPPITRVERSYGLVRQRRQRGRPKIERINVSQAQERETTYHTRMRDAQPHGNALKRSWELHRPRRRHGRIKIESRNVSRTQEVENAYLGRANTLRSIRRPRKQRRALSKLTFEHRMQGEPWRDDRECG